jgi:phosphoinositide-3-kinase regulatory subunit 4
VKYIDATEGPIVGLEHFNLGSQSLLVYATNKGKIHGWDLRMKGEAWVLNNPMRVGLLSSLVVEPERKWLVTGTNSGYFTCWDMRFHIPVKTWGHPSKTRIHKMLNHPQKDASWIFATSGVTSDVSVWDVESGTCKQMFRILSDAEALKPNVKPLPPPGPMDYGMEELQNPVKPYAPHGGIKALLNPDPSFLITAGDDRKIRYWNLQNVLNSYIISGFQQHPIVYNSQSFDNIQVYQEFEETPTSNAAASGVTSSSSTTSAATKFRGPASPSVHHRESILDVKVMELPHKMLISSGRDAIIKVWK